MSPESGVATGQPASRRLPMRAIGLTLALIVVSLGATAAIEPLRDAALDTVSGETASLRKDLRDLGAGGVALVAALAALHTFVWYPAEILDAAAGFVYGFWPAMAILSVCWTAQGMLAYEIGNRAARPILDRSMGHPRFNRVERAVNDGGVALLLAARLVPIVPFSLFSYVAGATAVPRIPFIWTTAVGYLPITAISVYLGTQLEEFSITDPRLWIAAGAIIALLLLTRKLKPLFHEDHS